MPRDIREYLAGFLGQPDPEAQDFLRNPRPYPGQRGVPMAAPLAPPEGVQIPPPAPGPYRTRLPRLSEIGPLLRPQEAQQGYRPPPMVYGPGGVTGERGAARVRLSDAALPSFLPQQPTPLPAQGGPQSPATFQPGTGQPAAPVQPGGQDDLDAAWEAALARVRATTKPATVRKPSRALPRR